MARSGRFVAVAVILVSVFTSPANAEPSEVLLARPPAAVLDEHGFTSRIEEQLEKRLGRKLDPDRADLGRLLFFDRLPLLKLDNACADCHSPTHGFGDTQPMTEDEFCDLVAFVRRASSTPARHPRTSPA